MKVLRCSSRRRRSSGEGGGEGSGEGAVQWRRRKRWSFPSLTARPLDRTRVRMSVGTGGRCEPRVSSPSPHLLFIALRDGGPPARRTAGRPRSGCESRSDSVVGPSQVEINLIFSPLISPYNLNLFHFISFPFHHRLVHRTCLVITVSTVRLTTIIHLSILK